MFIRKYKWENFCYMYLVYSLFWIYTSKASEFKQIDNTVRQFSSNLKRKKEWKM